MNFDENGHIRLEPLMDLDTAISEGESMKKSFRKEVRLFRTARLVMILAGSATCYYVAVNLATSGSARVVFILCLGLFLNWELWKRFKTKETESSDAIQITENLLGHLRAVREEKGGSEPLMRLLLEPCGDKDCPRCASMIKKMGEVENPN